MNFCVCPRIAVLPFVMVALCSSILATASPVSLRFYTNREYGIEVGFPSAARICRALSGEHPVGFYTWLDRPTNCNATRPPSASSMNVTALYNAAFQAAPQLDGCQSGEFPSRLGISPQGLAFPGRRSISCAVENADGSIDIFVAAQAGRWRRSYRSPEFRTALINYSAGLHTRPSRLREDLAAFRALISHIRIRTIVSN